MVSVAMRWLTILVMVVLLAELLWVIYQESLSTFQLKYITPEIKKAKPAKCDFTTNLQRTVLAINFNFPFYDVIPLLKIFYEKRKLFGKVVFCGDRKQDDVISLKENEGFQGYVCLAEAIKAYPGYDGYLYSNDDLLINWWNFNYDINRVWTGNSYRKPKQHHFIGQKHSKKEWHWWTDGTYTAVRCEKAFNKTLNLIKNSNSKSDDNNKNLSELNLERYLERFYRNVGNRTICIGGRSDFFYIPKKYADAYLFFSRIYSEENVFLEVAVPTILSFLSEYDEHLNLNGVYYVDQTGYSKAYLSGEAFFDTYNYNISFSHPFKISKSNLKQFFLTSVIPHGQRMYDACMSV